MAARAQLVHGVRADLLRSGAAVRIVAVGAAHAVRADRHVRGLAHGQVVALVARQAQRRGVLGLQQLGVRAVLAVVDAVAADAGDVLARRARCAASRTARRPCGSPGRSRWPRPAFILSGRWIVAKPGILRVAARARVRRSRRRGTFRSPSSRAVPLRRSPHDRARSSGTARTPSGGNPCRRRNRPSSAPTMACVAAIMQERRTEQHCTQRPASSHRCPPSREVDWGTATRLRWGPGPRHHTSRPDFRIHSVRLRMHCPQATARPASRTMVQR